MKYIVYLTINLKCKINNKHRIYVGVHKTDNPDIFDGYIGCGVKINQPSTYMYPKTPFQYAVKKYGVDSFIRITLYQFDNELDAYKKEKEIINNDFLKLDHVYNISIGGSVEDRYKPLYQFNYDGVLVKKWESSKDAYDFYGYPQNKWDSAKRWKCSFLGYYWSTQNSIDIKDFTNEPLSKITYLYNKNGKLLKEFNSRTECAKYLNYDNGELSRSIKNENLILKQYYVSDKLVDIFIPKPRVQYKNQKFYVYNKNGDFICECIGKKLMNVINLKSWSKIYHIFTHNNNWYKDFYISLNKVEKVPIKSISNSKSILVYDKYGNFIEECPSIKYTKEKYNIPSCKFKNIQNGEKHYNDFIFKYNSK